MVPSRIGPISFLIALCITLAAPAPAHAKAKKKKPKTAQKKRPQKESGIDPRLVAAFQAALTQAPEPAPPKTAPPSRTGEMAEPMVFGEKDAVHIQVHCMKTQPGDDLMSLMAAKKALAESCFVKPKKDFDSLDWMVKKIKPKTSNGKCISDLKKSEKENSPWRSLGFSERLSALNRIVKETEFPNEAPFNRIRWDAVLPCMAAVESETLEPLSTAQSNCMDVDWQTSRGLFHVNQGTIDDLMNRKASDGKPLMRGLLNKEAALSSASMHDALAASIPLQVRVAANVLAEKFRAAQRKLGSSYPFPIRKALELYNAADKKNFYAEGILYCANELIRNPNSTTALKHAHCAAHPNFDILGNGSPALWSAYCKCVAGKNTAKEETACQNALKSRTVVASQP